MEGHETVVDRFCKAWGTPFYYHAHCLCGWWSEGFATKEAAENEGKEHLLYIEREEKRNASH